MSSIYKQRRLRQRQRHRSFRRYRVAILISIVSIVIVGYAGGKNIFINLPPKYPKNVIRNNRHQIGCRICETVLEDNHSRKKKSRCTCGVQF